MCKTCRGRGRVWVDLRRFRFGQGFYEFMSAGTQVLRGDDGSAHHEIVCPDCDDSGSEVVPADQFADLFTDVGEAGA